MTYAKSGVDKMQNLKSVVKEYMYYLRYNNKEIPADLTKDAFTELWKIPEESVRNVQMGVMLFGAFKVEKRPEVIASIISTAFQLDDFEPLQREEIGSINGYIPIQLSGSGKKGIKTINISSISMIVSTCGGSKIVKPGSFSTSSNMGSADFFSMIGAKKIIDSKYAKSLLEEVGFCFFNIENLIPRFDSIYGNRFFTPHILSYGLAALTCPVKCPKVLYGISYQDAMLTSKVLNEFDIKESVVYYSTFDDVHFIDELVPFAQCGITYHDRSYRELSLNLSELFSNNEDLMVWNNMDIKNVLYEEIRLLAGKSTHQDLIDTIAINSALQMFVSGVVDSIIQGYRKAYDIILSGEAYMVLKKYIHAISENNDLLEKIYKESCT